MSSCRLQSTFWPTSDVPRSHVTQELETNLLTHMFALCLRVDEWATDTAILAGDLSMSVAKVNQLFKSLGVFVSRLLALRRNNTPLVLRLQDREAHQERA